MTSISLLARPVAAAIASLALVAIASASASASASPPTPTKIDPAGLYSVSCPSASQCTAVDGYRQEVTFDPNAPGTPTPMNINDGSSAVACPTTSQCTAVTFGGNEVTFNPTAPGNPTPAKLSGSNIDAVACPSATQCTAVGVSSNGQGDEVTFDPGAPGTPTPTPIPITPAGTGYVRGIACPSTTQCTAVGDSGQGVTFNPTAPGTPVSTTVDAGDTVFTKGGSLKAVACPALTQCTAIDSDGQVVTFNPISPGTPKPTSVESKGEPFGIACPSLNRCVAVGNGGWEVTLDPASPGTSSMTTIDGLLIVESVSCPSTTQCTAVDFGTGPNANGQQVTFDPTPPATVTKPPPPGGAAPVTISPPVITGPPTARGTLTCSTGSWTNNPTAFAYRWTRNGTLLVAPTTHTYAVGTLDEGTTLTCTVTATDPGGSASATSAAVHVPIPFVAHCPGATGQLSGRTIGLIHLGMTRAQARRAYVHHSNRGRQYQDFFCLTPIGVRAGYASPTLLARVSKPEQARIRGTVVWSSTSNPYYSLDGIRPGDGLADASARLHPTAVLHIGLNDWYLARLPGLTAVMKVRHGEVQELGIAVNELTATAAQRSALMHSFY